MSKSQLSNTLAYMLQFNNRIRILILSFLKNKLYKYQITQIIDERIYTCCSNNEQ